VPQETWKEELNEKLTPKLQELVLYCYNAKSFYEFQQSVRRAAQTLEKNRKASPAGSQPLRPLIPFPDALISLLEVSRSSNHVLDC
jgi:hypothetical protein